MVAGDGAGPNGVGVGRVNAIGVAVGVPAAVAVAVAFELLKPLQAEVIVTSIMPPTAIFPQLVHTVRKIKEHSC